MFKNKVNKISPRSLCRTLISTSTNQHRTTVNLIKTAGLIIGVAAGILSVTHPRFKLKSEPAAAQTQQPNVVVIMADDLSVGELNKAVSIGFMPNLQTHLINRGTTFTNSFVSHSLCCPSRSTFLTGQYTHNHGVFGNEPPSGGVTRLKDSSTLATWLKGAGYRTCLVGKYLNGYGNNRVADDPSDDSTYVPPGWDDWQGITSQNYYNYRINDNGTLVRYGTAPSDYQTDVLRERSVNFINESEASDSTPFFLFITPYAPHGPADPAPRHAGTASSIALPQPPSFNESDVTDKPTHIQNQPQLSSQKISDLQRLYRKRLESVRAVDDLIGQVVSVLEQNGELDNTVLMFTSDNGYLFGEHRLTTKTWVYEESIRVPLLIRAPGFPKQSVARFAINNDLAVTIADFANATPSIAVDGRSLIPLLSNPSLSTWRKRFLVEKGPPTSGSNYAAVRTSALDTATPQQIYVKHKRGDQEFYDLPTDRYQLQSLHNDPSRQPQMQTLQTRLANLKTCKGQSCRTAENN